MKEHRLEPYRDPGVMAFMLEAARVLDEDVEFTVWREVRSSEDEFEVHTRFFGTPARGVRLEERNGVDARSGYVNQERVLAALYGFADLKLEVETVDGVFEGSFATLRLAGEAALEARVLPICERMFSAAR